MIRRPTHPGNIVKVDYLLPMSITIKDMALRLSRAFDITPDFWLNLQKNYDLWHAETASKEWQKVKPFPKSLLHSNN